MCSTFILETFKIYKIIREMSAFQVCVFTFNKMEKFLVRACERKVHVEFLMFQSWLIPVLSDYARYIAFVFTYDDDYYYYYRHQ